MENHKELVAIDARIARIRDEVAGGKVTLESMGELDQLIDDRQTHLRENLTSQPSQTSAGNKDNLARA